MGSLELNAFLPLVAEGLLGESLREAALERALGPGVAVGVQADPGDADQPAAAGEKAGFRVTVTGRDAGGMDSIWWWVADTTNPALFQVLAFNVKAWPLVPDSAGRWIDGSDAKALSDVMVNLRRTVPAMQLYIQESFTHRLAESLKQGEVDVIVVALPVSTPVALSRLSHAGRPLALQVNGVALVPLAVTQVGSAAAGSAAAATQGLVDINIEYARADMDRAQIASLLDVAMREQT